MVGRSKWANIKHRKGGPWVGFLDLPESSVSRALDVALIRPLAAALIRPLAAALIRPPETPLSVKEKHAL